MKSARNPLVRRSVMIAIHLAIFALIFILFFRDPRPAASEIRQITPENGFVPDQRTAQEIAAEIWYPIYGQRALDERPYLAKMREDGVWVLEGTLPNADPWAVGGTVYAEIRQDNGKVIFVTHHK